jgi:DNA-binding GntR family transcriptional regulator
MSILEVPGGPESGATVGRVHAAVRISIVDGEIPPGTRINIEAIAREQGVSQTPVREALQRLEAEELVVHSPGRGYRTARVLDLAGLRAVFDFRLLIEPWAASTIASDNVVNPATDLELELKRFERIMNTSADLRQEMLGHDTRFHDMILAATGNEVVRRAYTQAHCHLHLFRLRHVDQSGTITLHEHTQIWRAVRANDSAAAEAAMYDHIRNSYRRSAHTFDRNRVEID